MSTRPAECQVHHLFDSDPKRRARGAVRVQTKRALGRAADSSIHCVRRTVAEFLADYELRELTEGEELAGFDYLLRTGLINQLPGRYGRIAMDLALNSQLTAQRY